MIVNGTSSIRTHMKLTVNNSNNLVITNKIAPDAIAAEINHNH